MAAVYCKQMERKIGTETCEQRQKDLTQFPYCENCEDYKNLSQQTTVHPIIASSNNDLVKEDLVNKFSNSKLDKTNEIDEAIETEKLNLRTCRECNQKLEPTTKNFSLAGKQRVMLYTCKKCVVKLRKESKERKKLEQNKQNNKTNDVINELQEKIKILTEEKANSKLKHKIEAVLPKDVSIKKVIKNNKLSLNIDYLDLSISITLDK